jgi:hypothetical protein
VRALARIPAGPPPMITSEFMSRTLGPRPLAAADFYAKPRGEISIWKLN